MDQTSTLGGEWPGRGDHRREAPRSCTAKNAPPPSSLFTLFLTLLFSLFLPQIRVIIITFIRTVTKAPHFLLGTPPIFVKSSSYPSHLTQSLLSIAEQSMSYESMEAVDRQLGSGIVLKQEVMCIAD